MNIPLNKFEDYLKNKNLKDRSIENYIYYYNKFIYESFNQETVSKFLAHNEHRNSVARSFLANLRKFIKTNYEELGISKDIRDKAVDVELPKLSGRVKQTLVKPLSYNEIFVLEEHLDSEKLKLQLLFTYFCGLRLGELLKITIMSFNWDDWKKDTSKMGECRVYGKGDKEGIALVPNFLMKRLARYIKSHQWNRLNSRIFASDSDNFNVKNRSRDWQIKLRSAGIKSGITKLGSDNTPIKDTVVHPHRLRHSFAKYLLIDKKFNLREVQEALRHSSIQSTQIYTYIDKEDLKRKLSQNDEET